MSPRMRMPSGRERVTPPTMHSSSAFFTSACPKISGARLDASLSYTSLLHAISWCTHPSSPQHAFKTLLKRDYSGILALAYLQKLFTLLVHAVHDKVSGLSPCGGASGDGSACHRGL